MVERLEWEYKCQTVQSDQENRHENELNVQGRDGWKVVGIIQLGPTSVRYVLMRQKK